ncbi:MAG: hypothetical protein ACO24H_03225 [Polynucleobacter sp.]
MNTGLTVGYEDFLPEVVQYVPDVPEFIAINAIRNACIEFCEKSRYLQTDLAPVNLVANQSTYTVIVPPDTKFVDIVEAYANDVLLIPKSSEELSRIYRYTDWRSVEGQPMYITREVYTSVQLVPFLTSVTAGQQLSMRISYAPTRDSAEISEDIYEQFLEYISFGARYRLYSTPKQAYYDRGLAMEYLRLFRAGINEARVRVNKGLSRTSGRIEYQRFV